MDPCEGGVRLILDNKEKETDLGVRVRGKKKNPLGRQVGESVDGREGASTETERNEERIR